MRRAFPYEKPSERRGRFDSGRSVRVETRSSLMRRTEGRISVPLAGESQLRTDFLDSSSVVSSRGTGGGEGSNPASSTPGGVISNLISSIRAPIGATLVSASNGSPDDGILRGSRGAIQPIISFGTQHRLPGLGGPQSFNLSLGRARYNLLRRFSRQRRFKLAICLIECLSSSDEGSRKARDHTVIGGEASASFGSGNSRRRVPLPPLVTALVLDQREIAVRDLRERR